MIVDRTEQEAAAYSEGGDFARAPTAADTARSGRRQPRPATSAVRVGNTTGLESVVRERPRSIDRVFGGRPLPARLKGAVIALGNFDGFHLGHRAVAERTIELARSRGVPAIIATFDPHPKRLFKADATSFRLTSLDQRQRLFARTGVDAMMVFEFNRALANVTPEQFVNEWLRDASGVVTGENFAFGRARAGTVELLAELGVRRGMTHDVVRAVSRDGEIISSSRIRAAIQLGDCVTAAALLTRPYAIAGELRPGVRMDPGLPLLDASLRLGDYLRPRRGVYAVKVHLPGGRVLTGSAFQESAADQGPEQLLELFLVDLDEADLGEPIVVELVAHLHDAHETYDLPELRKRIELDRRQARELVSSAH